MDVENTPPAGAGVTLDDCHYVTVNPSTSWCGWTDVTIRVADPGELWDNDTFRVAVTWSCRGPLPVPGQAAAQDEPVTLDLTPTNRRWGSDMVTLHLVYPWQRGDTGDYADVGY